MAAIEPRPLISALLLLAVTIAGAAVDLRASAASVLHDQSEYDRNSAYALGHVHHAQDFPLPSPARVTSISVWLAETNFPGVDNGVIEGLSSLSWSIFRDDLGKPGVAMATGQLYDLVSVDEPTTFGFGGDLMRFDIPINVTLLRRGTYWFSVHTTQWDFESNVLAGWVWSPPGRGSGHYFDRLTTSGVTWEGPGGEQAFRVVGIWLPEPSGAALATLALLSLIRLAPAPVRQQ